MTLRAQIEPSSLPDSELAPEPPQPIHGLSALAVPLISTLLVTFGAVWMLCRSPWPSSLTWRTLIHTAIFYLAVTLAAHIFAVWFNRRLFPDHIEAPILLLLLTAWPSVVWLPLLVLLIREESLFAAAVPPLIAAAALLSLKPWRPPAVSGGLSALADNPLSTLFHPHRPPSLLGSLAPALAFAIAFQAGVVELALNHAFLAGCLFAFSIAVPVWEYPGRPRPQPTRFDLSWLRTLAPRTAAVFALLCLFLIPYLKYKPKLGLLASLLGAGSPSAAAAPPIAMRPAPRHGGAYSGIILLPPLKPRPKVVIPPPPTDPRLATLREQPVIIPFSGEYWYFKHPDPRPAPDAVVVRGEPTAKHISSTDLRPLSMEAHQRLDSLLNTACCRSVLLSLQNADTAPGVIFVELLLKNTNAKSAPPQSLGTFPLPSSEDPRVSPVRATVTERLSFPISPHLHEREFDEITVAIKPAPDRDRAGARVAIRSFELIPR